MTTRTPTPSPRLDDTLSEETLRQIAEAEAAMTGGPWAERGRDVDHDRFVSEGRNPGDAAGLGCEIDGPPEGQLRGQFHNHADAAGIVLLRNHAAELLRGYREWLAARGEVDRLAERAEKLVLAFVEGRMTGDEAIGHLRSALAASPQSAAQEDPAE